MGAVAIAVAGCSVSVHPTISASEVASQAADALTQQIGVAPADFNCGDGQVDAVDGEEVRCTLTASDGSTIGATVTLSDVSVDGSKVNFHLSVAVDEK